MIMMRLNLFVTLFFISEVFAESGVQVSGVAESARISRGSLFDTFAAGGWVMWPILIGSLVGIAYGLERLFALRQNSVVPVRLKSAYGEVMSLLHGKKIGAKGAISQLSSALGDSEGERLFGRFLKREFSSVRDLEQILQEYVDVTQWRLQKNIKPIGLVVQVTPLLGLFGTVLGMIQAFDVVADQGLGKPELLAHGMAVALLTTGFGLGVAIPCSLLNHYLMEKAQHAALGLYNMLHELSMELCENKD